MLFCKGEGTVCTILKKSCDIFSLRVDYSIIDDFARRSWGWQSSVNLRTDGKDLMFFEDFVIYEVVFPIISNIPTQKAGTYQYFHRSIVVAPNLYTLGLAICLEALDRFSLQHHPYRHKWQVFRVETR